MGGHQAAEGGSLARGDGDVGVAPAEHHHGTGRGRDAVGVQAQAPPHPERIDDADACPPVDQALDQPLGGVGLARPGGAHDGQPLLQHRRGQHARHPPGIGRVGRGRRRPTLDGGGADGRAMGGEDAADGGLAHAVVPGHLGGGAPPAEHLVDQRCLLRARQLRAAPGPASCRTRGAMSSTDLRLDQAALRHGIDHAGEHPWSLHIAPFTTQPRNAAEPPFPSSVICLKTSINTKVVQPFDKRSMRLLSSPLSDKINAIPGQRSGW